MFLTHRPASAEITRFLDRSRDSALSYSPVGMALRPPAGFDHDVDRVTLGQGPATFDLAVRALMSWRHFDLEWVDVHPASAPIAVGTTVAVAIRHLGFWSLNGARIVKTIGDPAGPTCGFAYGTLATHAECGEEIFLVRRDAATDQVYYEIQATSRPRAPLARIGYPIARRLQARFRRDSAAAMARAVAGESSATETTSAPTNPGRVRG